MVLTKLERFPRQIWKALPPMAKLVFLANGQVEIDEDGLPVLADEMLASVVRDVQQALAAT